MEERAIEPTVAEGLGQARPERLTAEQDRGAGGAAGRARRRRLPALPPPRRHRQRQDRGVPARGGARAGAGRGQRWSWSRRLPSPRSWWAASAAASAAHVAVLHCGLKDRERLLHWQASAHGRGAASRWACARRCSRRWRTSASSSWTRSTTPRSSRRRSSATRRGTWRWCAPSRPGPRWCSARPRRRWRRWRTPAAAATGILAAPGAGRRLRRTGSAVSGGPREPAAGARDDCLRPNGERRARDALDRRTAP